MFANCLQPRKVLCGFALATLELCSCCFRLDCAPAAAAACAWGLLTTTRAPHTHTPSHNKQSYFCLQGAAGKKHKSHARTPIHTHRDCGVPLVAGFLVSYVPRCGTQPEQPRVASFRRLLTWSDTTRVAA